MSKILIALTNHGQLGDTGKETGYFVSEAAHPYFVFTKAGHEVDFVSPKGGEPPKDGLDLDDPQQQAFLESLEVSEKLRHTLRPDEVDSEDYDAIFFAGGHGVMWDFPDNRQLATLAASIYLDGDVVAAVCHGPAALVNVRLGDGKYLVDGKTVSAFTNEEEAAVELDSVVPFLLEDKLIERGAKISKAPKFEAKVSVSERLVTGQNPASATGVAEAVVKLLQESPVDA
jgi:putative intracellular protease/amidase